MVKTVTVMCGVRQGLLLTLHQPIDFGKGAVQTRLINEPVVLKPGPNPGIDKAFFEAWKAQNQNLSVMPLITSEDEPESGTQQQGAESAAPGGANTMVDIDAQARHVQNLIKFRERAEKVLDWAEAKMKAEGAKPEPGQEPVAAAGAVVTVDDLTSVRLELADLGEHIAALQVSKDEAHQFLDDLGEMLAWFQGNRAGLEVVLAMGEAQPGDAPAQITGLSSGPAASNVDVDQSGDTTFHPSTDGAPGPSPTLIPGAPPAPGPVPEGGAGGTSLVPGADVGTGLAPAAGGPGGPDVANLADAAARGAAGAPVAEVGAGAPAPGPADPAAALTAASVIKDPSADPSTAT